MTCSQVAKTHVLVLSIPYSGVYRRHAAPRLARGSESASNGITITELCRLIPTRTVLQTLSHAASRKVASHSLFGNTPDLTVAPTWKARSLRHNVTWPTVTCHSYISRALHRQHLPYISSWPRHPHPDRWRCAIRLRCRRPPHSFPTAQYPSGPSTAPRGRNPAPHTYPHGRDQLWRRIAQMGADRAYSSCLTQKRLHHAQAAPSLHHPAKCTTSHPTPPLADG